jgi:hypothetical protein
MTKPQQLCAICASRDATPRRLGNRGESTCSEFFSLCMPCRSLVFRKFNKRRGRQRDRIVEIPSRREWFEVLRTSWDEGARCFRCMISGVPLLPDAPKSPRYPTLEHAAPGKGHGGWLVVAAAINDMKSDFDLDEFKRIVPLVAQVFQAQGDPEASSDLLRILDQLKHWRRVKTSPGSNAIPVEESV